MEISVPVPPRPPRLPRPPRPPRDTQRSNPPFRPLAQNSDGFSYYPILNAPFYMLGWEHWRHDPGMAICYSLTCGLFGTGIILDVALAFTWKMPGLARLVRAFMSAYVAYFMTVVFAFVGSVCFPHIPTTFFNTAASLLAYFLQDEFGPVTTAILAFVVFLPMVVESNMRDLTVDNRMANPFVVLWYTARVWNMVWNVLSCCAPSAPKHRFGMSDAAFYRTTSIVFTTYMAVLATLYARNKHFSIVRTVNHVALDDYFLAFRQGSVVQKL